MSAQAVRVEGEAMRPGWFVVPSATFPGEEWRVRFQAPGMCWCPCPGFSHRGNCRHADLTADAVEQEARASLERATTATRTEAARRLAAIAEEMSR